MGRVGEKQHLFCRKSFGFFFVCPYWITWRSRGKCSHFPPDRPEFCGEVEDTFQKHGPDGNVHNLLAFFGGFVDLFIHIFPYKSIKTSLIIHRLSSRLATD